MSSFIADRRDIVEFVKLIESFPCLYNTKTPENNSRTATADAWSQIARKMNMLVAECKEKWRHIRIAYTKTLKHRKTYTKPYYLADHLQFLLPFLKVYEDNKNQGQSPSNSDPNSDEEESLDNKHGIIYTDEFYNGENNVDTLENTDSESVTKTDYLKQDFRSSIIDRSYVLRQRLKRKCDAQNDTEFAEVKMPSLSDNYSGHTDRIEGNPRKMFLLSLMPDIEELTDTEMRIFRKDVVMSIDRIISSRKS